jgi:hypothetical protein
MVDLLDIIRDVRQRWRLKLAARGAAGVVAFGLALLVVSAFGLESLRFTAGSIIAFRIILFIALAGAMAWLLVRPLLRRVTDEQVALYLEEHEPSLGAAIVSAVEAEKKGRESFSPALVRRLVESAIEKCEAIERGRRIERAPLQRYVAAAAAVALSASALFLLGPGSFRHAVSALLIVSRSVEAAAPYRIDVAPGHATVPRGADQTVTARLQGFDVDQVSLMTRKSPTTPFERVLLVRGESGRFEGMLFDLAAPVDYFVEAAGVRSPVFTLKVVDLPYVKQLELEYHFPAYMGLAPRKIEDGGDIVVPGGTEVRVRVTPTMTAPGGRIVLHDTAAAPLGGAAGGTLEGRFVADRDGFYRIELTAPTGERVAASPQYTIDVLADQAPSVWFSKPGRDTTASPIEEVFVEARADDDYGVRGLELVYSLNGGPDKIVKLFDGRTRLAEVTAGHTFYLEELNVQPGDSVSYYARASDNDTLQGGKRSTSDLYFLRVRPYRKEFRRAPSDAGGGGGGAGAAQVGALSEQQRQIIAATFNVQRDRRTSSRDKLRESTVVVALAQARLREQVEGLVARMHSRLVEPDPAFQKIARLLPQAVAEMKAAEAKLQAINPDAALPPEHRALQFLQKAEEEYELQVSVGRNAGGAGGGAGSIAEDLADLFELELDRMANQYETADRAAQQNADRQLDELMEKLKELARRQEQEAERQRRRAAAGQASAGGGGDQRALAEQAEEAARRLETISREENRPELMDSARRLREAANAMRRAAASGDPSAAAQAAEALERLRETERQLRRSQSDRAKRDVGDALRQAEELAREQGEIAGEVGGLEGAGERRQEQVQQLRERKEALEAKVGQLEQQLDRSAAEMRRDERDASRKVAEAAGTIRDKRVRDKIRYSRSVIAGGAPPEYARALEEDISTNLDAVRRKLAEAASSVGRARPDATAEALDKARRLARGLESLEQRTRERTGRQGSGDRGRGSGDPEAGSQADGRGGVGDTIGPWRDDGGGWGDRRPGRLSREDVRQFRGEIRQWTNEAQQLRRLLREQQIDPKDLDALLRALRALDDDRVYQDVEELQRLQAFVSEGLKRFEYGLRRRLEAGGNEAVLSGSDEVPEQFRKLVEQYYRSLAKAPR